MLLCGDMCSGTCGKCKQGRLHIPCEEMCNKINPCNHTYDYSILCYLFQYIYIYIYILFINYEKVRFQ